MIALGSAAYTVRSAARTSKEVEQLKAKLAQEAAAAEAHRNLEYQARAKIYAQSEPIVLKLAESAEFAASRIIALADPRRAQVLQATTTGSWMLSNSSETIAITHALLEPLAWSTLLRETTNFVDLRFEHRLSEIYTLARAAYQTHLDDYVIAEIPPAFPYDPLVAGWRQKRQVEPAIYWWQGITRGRLDPAIELCLNRDAGRAATAAEFEKQYLELFDLTRDARHKCLGLFCNPLYNFRAEDRPIYWRILLCQLLIYRRLARRSRMPSDVLMTPTLEFDTKDVALLCKTSTLRDDAFDASLDAALTYTARVLAAPS
ncbi:hypothetical protein [Nocardia sp. NPDC058497]|uniref:hypothetical protein n=1 Tax=Nocardia sp. NPDC058497 TaxID=3346529 RepID=UPI00365AA014